MLRQVPRATTAALPEPPARVAPGAGLPSALNVVAPATLRGRAGARGARWYAGARCCCSFHPCGRACEVILIRRTETPRTRRWAGRAPPAPGQAHARPLHNARPGGLARLPDVRWEVSLWCRTCGRDASTKSSYRLPSIQALPTSLSVDLVTSGFLITLKSRGEVCP